MKSGPEKIRDMVSGKYDFNTVQLASYEKDSIGKD